MKLRSLPKSIPSASLNLINASAVPAVAWSRRDDEEMAALRLSEIRRRPLVRESYRKTPAGELSPLIMELGKAFIPCTPPRFKRKKDGSLVEEKMMIPFLKVEAGPYQFKVTKNTDPATILRRSREISRRCGEAEAKRFAHEAMEIVGPAEKPAPRRPSPGWYVPASGKDCRRGAHTPSRWMAGAFLNYKKPA